MSGPGLVAPAWRRAVAIGSIAAASTSCGWRASEAVEILPSASACTVVEQSETLSDIEWYRPAADAKLDELERWCESVGPPVFVPAPTEAAAPRPLQAGDALVVVSWNVHASRGSVPEFVDALRSRVGTDTHFVLLLQEVLRRGDAVPATAPIGVELPRAIRPGKGRADEIVSVAGTLNLSLLYAPSMRNGDDTDSASREDRGNAILSTLPLTAPKVIELPLRQQRRVSVAVDLAYGTPPVPSLRVVSAHVDTWAGGDQARSLAALLRLWNDDTALFVGSDLNALFGRFDPRVRSVNAAVKRRDCGGRSYLHLLSLDQVFTDLDGWVQSCRVLADRFGSDHAPLVAELIVQ
jgi:endonuclease/exonuclease/phosphatase family metal-dependent hydrolase